MKSNLDSNATFIAGMTYCQHTHSIIMNNHRIKSILNTIYRGFENINLRQKNNKEGNDDKTIQVIIENISDIKTDQQSTDY